MSGNRKSEVREASALKEPKRKFGMAELQKIQDVSSSSKRSLVLAPVPRKNVNGKYRANSIAVTATRITTMYQRMTDYQDES